MRRLLSRLAVLSFVGLWALLSVGCNESDCKSTPSGTFSLFFQDKEGNFYRIPYDGPATGQPLKPNTQYTITINPLLGKITGFGSSSGIKNSGLSDNGTKFTFTTINEEGGKSPYITLTIDPTGAKALPC